MSNRQFWKSQVPCDDLLPSELSTYYTNLPITASEKNFAGALHSSNDQLISSPARIPAIIEMQSWVTFEFPNLHEHVDRQVQKSLQ